MKKERRIPTSISFEAWVLDALESRAAQESTTVSNLVNYLIKILMENELVYLRKMAKHHNSRFNIYKELLEKVEQENADAPKTEINP